MGKKTRRKTPERPSSRRPSVRAAGGALDMLVRQFSQPLACLRELIQNAIDAGSNAIEVELDPKPQDGCWRLTVIDTGEGMTEAIIQTQLTRLFNSTKENDLTKVGKFGIGFVSVFALDPIAVTVDTGRDGEFWRVLFHPDRSFDLIRRDQPIEGTSVSLYLPKTQHPWGALLKEVRATLEYWCRHCSVPITLNQQPINQPFTLEAPVQLHYHETGTRLVVALTQQSHPLQGYYNQGLTLLENAGDERFPGMTFKLDSRYFEHTLTRDNLVKNEEYDKAIAMLRREFERGYPELLADKLRDSADAELWRQLDQLAPLNIDIQRVHSLGLFRDHAGNSYSVAELKKRGPVYYCEEANPLQQAVHQPSENRLVLQLRPGHSGLLWLDQININALPLECCWGLCAPTAVEELAPLLESCQQVRGKLRPAAIVPVTWSHRPPNVGLLYQAPKPGIIQLSAPSQAQHPLLLDADHPFVSDLIRLHQWNPSLALQMLLQHCILLRPEQERPALTEQLTLLVLGQLQP